MKVLIKKASSWGYREVKEINTLEELLKIYPALIIYTDKPTIKIFERENEKIDCVVKIYDDFVE